MQAVLHRLSPDDGLEVYEMLQEIPADENGFLNAANGLSAAEYRDWLSRSDALSREIGLIGGWRVPESIWWLYVDGRPVGVGKLRHFLTESLRREGGHIGYAIRPAERGNGYGKLLLSLLRREAAARGIDRLLLTIKISNWPSLRVALANGGEIDYQDDQRYYVWVPSAENTGH
jgi:predicted acetyltransferase